MLRVPRSIKQAMQESDRTEFLDATTKENNDHSERQHWKLQLRNDLPPGMKTIWLIWSFKRKRFPDRSKHPAAFQHAALLTVYEGDCATTIATKLESPSLSEFIGSPHFQSQNLFEFMVGVLTVLSLVSKLSRHHVY